MRELHYGSGVMTVSFDVCSAVFDYAVALGNAGMTDRITVPVLADGERGFSNLLLGPQTQLYCSAVREDHPDGEVDLDDVALIAELAHKTVLLGSDASLVVSSGTIGVDMPELD